MNKRNDPITREELTAPILPDTKPPIVDGRGLSSATPRVGQPVRAHGATPTRQEQDRAARAAAWAARETR